MVIAGLGATAVGQGATDRTVRSADFARDALMVNGIRASRRPAPGRLLALNANGRYPRSVVPPVVGPDGPRGAQGAGGPAGPPGNAGGDLVFNVTPELQSYPANFERATFGALSGVPDGSWLLLGGGNSGSTDSPPAMFSCHISRNAIDLATSDTSAARGVGGSRVNPHLMVTGATFTEPANLGLRCSHTEELSAGIEHAWLGAVRVGQLETRRVDP